MADTTNPEPQSSSSGLSKGVEDSLNEPLNIIRDKIIARAKQYAKDADPSAKVSITHIAKAIGEFAPGVEFPPASLPSRRHLFDVISPVAIVSAVLAVIFAAFGLWAILSGTSAKIGGEAILSNRSLCCRR